MAEKKCTYQGYEFGAGTYPDSICIDGRLFDADHCDNDGNLYDTDEDIPCPMCRPKEAVKWWARRMCNGDEKEAFRKARFLVTDIRKNRGVTA